MMKNFNRLKRQNFFCKIAFVIGCVSLSSYAHAAMDLKVNGSDKLTVSGVISGAGGINKVGTGTAILSAANTYTGGTTVSAGELLITGSVLGDVTAIAAGTTLGGTGTIAGDVVNTATGTVRTGGPTLRTGGTVADYLTIGGDYNQSALSTFLVNLSPLAFDYLAVTGAATMDVGAILNVFVQPGTYATAGVTHSILTAAGGITGTFAIPTNLNAANADVDLSMAKVGNEYHLTVSGKAQAFSSVTTVTSADLAKASGQVTLTTANITEDTIVSAPLVLQSVTNTVTTAPGKTTTISGPIESVLGSTTTFGGGGTFVFDLTSTGTNFLGGIDVGAATKLIINTAVSGPITLAADSTLKGIGPFNDISNSHGIFWGGNSINTVPLANYTCGAASTTVVEFKPAVSGLDATKYTVTGTADLDGKLKLTPEVGGTYPMTFTTGLHEYTVLTADTIEGNFATLEAPDIAAFSYTLDYSDDYKQLLVKLTVGTDTTLTSDVRVQGAGADFGYTTIAAPYFRRVPNPPVAMMNQHDATEAADSVTTQVSMAIGGGSAATKNVTHTGDGFKQLNLASMGHAPHKDRLHAVLHALQENGPISFEQNQHRIWFSPYTTMGRTDAAASQAGNHRWAVGSLAGYEYRNVARKRLFGLILGGSTGLQTVTGTPESWIRSKSLNTGFYAGTDLFEHARVETIGLWIHNAMKKQRSGNDATKGAYHAISKIKQDTLVGDVSASYLLKLNDNWSLRPNIGNTYFMTTTDKSTETNTPSPINTAASRSQTSQCYCGIGGRYSWETSKVVYRITSVFEIGREYYKKGTPIKTTAFDSNGLLPPQVFSTNGASKKITTKYLTINGTILDEENGLKHVLCYSGQFTNGSRTHSLMLKFEKRF